MITDSLHHTFLEAIRHHHYLLHILLVDVGVYPGQPPLLFILNKESGLIQKELASRLHVKPATLTVMLKRMEKAGLIMRRQDQEDQRISRVYITEKGQKAYKMAEEVMRKIEIQMFSKFDEAEKEKLKEFLNRIADNLVAACQDNKPC